MLIYYPVEQAHRPADNSLFGEDTITICGLLALDARRNPPAYQKLLAVLGSVVGSKRVAASAMSTLRASSSSITTTGGGKTTSVLYCPPAPVGTHGRSRQLECLSLVISDTDAFVKSTILRKGKKADVMTPSFFMAVYDTCVRNAADIIREKRSSDSTRYNILFFSRENFAIKAARCTQMVKRLDGCRIKSIRYF